MNSSQIILARVQLKTDTEANWNVIANTFVPLQGELIIYSPDNTHGYSRLKVGDGTTTLARLSFIDAGTINGDTLPPSDISMHATQNDFPASGEANRLYVALDTNKIYCYTNDTYLQLSNFVYTPRYTQVANITSWASGRAATFSVANGRLTVKPGTAPSLGYTNLSVVADITRE